MKLPLITWFVIWAQVVALGAALYQPSRLRGPRIGIAVFLASSVAANLAAWLWTSYFRLGNNHFITYINQPLQGVALLWAIGEWQVLPVLRRTVRLCVPLVLVCWFVDVVVIGDTGNFSMFGLPVQGLVVLAAALMALVTRSVLGEEPVLRQGWFWILSGVAVLCATGTAVYIMQHAAIEAGDYVFVDLTHRVKSGINLVALLAIIGGLLWPSRPAFSGESSSPVLSR